MGILNSKENSDVLVDIDPAVIGHQIREVRMAQKITQAHLAEEIGVPTQSISDYERGVSFPSIPTLLKLSKWADKSLEFWFDMERPQIVSSEDSLSEVIDFLQQQGYPQKETIPIDVDPEISSSHLAFPWAYFCRSSFLAYLLSRIAERQGYSLCRIPNDPVFYMVPSQKRQREEELLFYIPPHFTLEDNALYILTSPYKHPSVEAIFEKLLLDERILTKFLISDQRDLFFGYPCKTVALSFGDDVYRPVFYTDGNARANFTDYAVLIKLRIPEQTVGADEEMVKVNKLLICSGCHRLGTGAGLSLILDSSLLEQFLTPTSIDMEDDFELILKIDCETGYFPSADNISVVNQRKITA